jgi:DNA repair exonuclease SbcCD ATPase subunit
MRKMSLVIAFFILFGIRNSFKKGISSYYHNHMLLAIPGMIATKLLFWKLKKSSNSKEQATKQYILNKTKELSREWEELSQNVILLEEALNAEQKAYDVRLQVLQEKQQEHRKLTEMQVCGKNMLFDLMNNHDILPVTEFRTACDVYFGALSRSHEVVNELHKVEKEFAECYNDWGEKRKAKEEKLQILKERVAEIEAEIRRINVID